MNHNDKWEQSEFQDYNQNEKRNNQKIPFQKKFSNKNQKDTNTLNDRTMISDYFEPNQRKIPLKKMTYSSSKQNEEWQPDSNQMYQSIPNRQENYDSYKNKNRKKKLNENDYSNYSTENNPIKQNISHNFSNPLVNQAEKKKQNFNKNNLNQIPQEIIMMQNNKINYNNNKINQNFTNYNNQSENSKINSLNMNNFPSNNVVNNNILNTQGINKGYINKNIQGSINTGNRLNKNNFEKEEGNEIYDGKQHTQDSENNVSISITLPNESNLGNEFRNEKCEKSQIISDEKINSLTNTPLRNNNCNSNSNNLNVNYNPNLPNMPNNEVYFNNMIRMQNIPNYTSPHRNIKEPIVINNFPTSNQRINNINPHQQINIPGNLNKNNFLNNTNLNMVPNFGNVPQINQNQNRLNSNLNNQQYINYMAFPIIDGTNNNPQKNFNYQMNNANPMITQINQMNLINQMIYNPVTNTYPDYPIDDIRNHQNNLNQLNKGNNNPQMNYNPQKIPKTNNYNLQNPKINYNNSTNIIYGNNLNKPGNLNKRNINNNQNNNIYNNSNPNSNNTNNPNINNSQGQIQGKIKYVKSDKNLFSNFDQTELNSNQDLKSSNNPNKNWRGYNNNPSHFNSNYSNSSRYNNLNNNNTISKINDGEDSTYNDEKYFGNEAYSQKEPGSTVSSVDNIESNLYQNQFKSQPNNSYIKIIIKLKDKYETIELQKEDDILLQAKEFCSKNNLSPDLIKPIYNYINQSLNSLKVILEKKVDEKLMENLNTAKLKYDEVKCSENNYHSDSELYLNQMSHNDISTLDSNTSY